MVNIPLFTGFYTSQVVSRISSINSRNPNHRAPNQQLTVKGWDQPLNQGAVDRWDKDVSTLGVTQLNFLAVAPSSSFFCHQGIMQIFSMIYLMIITYWCLIYTAYMVMWLSIRNWCIWIYKPHKFQKTLIKRGFSIEIMFGDMFLNFSKIFFLQVFLKDCSSDPSLWMSLNTGAIRSNLVRSSEIGSFQLIRRWTRIRW